MRCFVLSLALLLVGIATTWGEVIDLEIPASNLPKSTKGGDIRFDAQRSGEKVELNLKFSKETQWVQHVYDHKAKKYLEPRAIATAGELEKAFATVSQKDSKKAVRIRLTTKDALILRSDICPPRDGKGEPECPPPPND